MVQEMEIAQRFEVDANTALFYRAFIPIKQSLVLIFVHGADQHTGDFLDLARCCVAHNIAFYAFDLRGFGQSTGKRGHIHSFDEYLEDLDKFVSFVHKMYPTDPLFVLGHSLGGTIVTRYVQERKNTLVKGTVLSAPVLSLRFHVPVFFRLLCHSLSLMTPTTSIHLRKWQDRIPRIFSGSLGDKLTDEFVGAAQFSTRWISEVLINGHRALKESKNLQTPTLCLCGLDDPIVDPAVVEEFYESLCLNHKKYVAFQDKHNILQDACKEDAFLHIVTWLKDQSTLLPPGKSVDSHQVI